MQHIVTLYSYPHRLDLTGCSHPYPYPPLTATVWMFKPIPVPARTHPGGSPRCS